MNATSQKSKEWKNSLTALKESGVTAELTHLDSRTSSVTTSWGVNWDENYIARDLMQNFFDANRECLGDVRLQVHGNTVEITAPAEFELARLFYLGSEKGGDDVGLIFPLISQLFLIKPLVAGCFIAVFCCL